MKKTTEATLKTLFVAVIMYFAAACTVQEETESWKESGLFSKYYAQIESPAEPEARTYADDNLKVLWNADDRVSIFSKNTYNQQYKFDGQTGDNSGSFSVIQDPGYVTGNELPYTYSVYPYREGTSISNAGVLTLTLLSDQTYAQDSFGPGDNTMVAVAEGNVIVYKNLGGYLMFKLYGEGITVSSISLKGNNGELLCGNASVEIPLGGAPSLELLPASAGTELTLNCATPVALGASADQYTAFWFVLPPVTFSEGITLTITEGDGTVFTKNTNKSITISRNTRSRMSPLQVEPGTAPTPPNNEIWYTSTDGQIIVPSVTDCFGASIVSNTYENGRGILKFDSDVTMVGDENLSSSDEAPFYSKKKLESIILPSSVKKIAHFVFGSCSSLNSIVLPPSLVYCGIGIISGSCVTEINFPETETIAGNPLYGCRKLSKIEGPYASSDGRCLIKGDRMHSFAGSGVKDYTVPDGVVLVDGFQYFNELEHVSLPSSVKIITGQCFLGCSSLKDFIIPETVEEIHASAFYECSSLTSINIPKNTTIYPGAFSKCVSLSAFSGRYASEDGRLLVDKNAVIAFAPAGLKEYEIPSGITKLYEGGFMYLTELENLIIPSSVNQISFLQGTSIKTITCLAETAPHVDYSFSLKLNNLEALYVPSESVEEYKAAQYWNAFADRIQAIPEPTQPNNEIWYTSTDGEIVTPYVENAFNVNVVSNTYENGKGIIKLDGSLTKLNQQAFYQKTTLSSIQLPSSVTEISVLALSNTALTGIEVPEGVGYINNGALSYNPLLKTIRLPQSLTGLGDNPFDNCVALERFEGKYASDDGRCLIVGTKLKAFAPAGLTSFVVPAGITEIMSDVFHNYTALTSITLPSGLQHIRGAAFRNCTFAEMDLPDGLLSISGMAFWNCSNLTEITIPASVSEIYYGAFNYCSSLNKITCLATNPPSGVESTFEDTNNCPIYVPAESVDAYKAAAGWSAYAERIQAIAQPNNEIWYTTTDGSTVQIANESVLNAGVVSNTYENGKGIIKLDGDLTRIGTIKGGYSLSSDGFLRGGNKGAAKLKTISFPESLDAFCTFAIYGCTKLERIDFPATLSFLGSSAVDNCTALKTVAVPECGEIRNNPFPYCTGIESFSGPHATADGQFLVKDGKIHSFAMAGRTTCSVPEGITDIAANVFGGATFKDLYLPSSLITLSTNAVSGVSTLEKIVFSEGLKTIGMHAFSYCTSLTDVTLPESLVLLDYAAFEYCSSLSQIHIPSGTVIKMNPFVGCSSLASFSGRYASSDGRYLADGAKLLSIAPAGLTSFVVPDGIEVLDWYLFANSDFVSIIVPEGVSTVNCGCFNNCKSLTSLTMPSTWEKYDGDLLYNCPSLEKLVSYATTPPVNLGNSTNSFMFNTNNCPIYVPAGAVDAYKAAAVWSGFADRIKPLGEMYETVDLGLPSGTKWASFNVGADTPEGYGLFYAWGEVAPKTEYSWSTYAWGESASAITKYNQKALYGKEGYTDNLTQLEDSDDVAHVMLGGAWRIPTHNDWDELKSNCTWTWTTQNGVKGLKLTSSINGNSIFLSGAGNMIDGSLNERGSYGHYWSSSLYDSIYAWGIDVRFDGLLGHNSIIRAYGMSVRPVNGGAIPGGSEGTGFENWE